MKTTNKTILFEIPDRENVKSNPKLLRVIISNEFTRVDFGYSALRIYDRGGWIRIAPHTFIEVEGTDKKYKLTQAEGIPIAPVQHHFESTKDWQFFSLFFEPIPQENCIISIIEEVNPDPNDFNYLGINLAINQGVRIREEVIF
jgi:hypothetical protein